MQLLYKTAVVCAVALALGARAAASADDLTSYKGTAATSEAAKLHASIVVAGNGLSRTLAIEEHVASSNARIRSYDVDMEKRMHLIVVSDDLQQFMHIHPVLDSGGAFRIVASFPGPGLYHLYADAAPTGLGHAVFRFDVPVGASNPTSAPRHFFPIGVATLGDYVVRLSTVHVKAGTDTPLIISIMKDGEPASDLHPYLGAYAHIVAIGVSDLSYTHVHAMNMSAMSSGMSMESAPAIPANATVPATMPIHVTLGRPGLYKVWVQFNGGSRLYAAPFVIQAG